MTSKTKATPKTATDPEATGVTFRAEGLDLIATLPDGKGTEVTVSMALPMGEFKELLPKMMALDEQREGDEPDPVETMETLESILPASVVETCSTIHMPWALAIYMEWISRLGGLMGKALSG